MSQNNPHEQYHLEVTPAKRIRMTVTQTATAPNMNVSVWGIVAGDPPRYEGQQDVKASFTILGDEKAHATVAADKSALHQPILSLSYPVNNGHEVTAQAVYEVTLMSRVLRPGPPKASIPPLDAALRRIFLADAFSYDYKTQAFQDWLNRSALRKGASESDLDFAYRLLQNVSSNFKYELIWGEASPASVICSRGSSNCGGLSAVFVAALRANGIPARIISGRMAVSSTKPNDPDTYHNKAEFYAEGIGWVPVEVAGASDGRSVDGLMGNDAGDLVVMTFDEPVLDSQRRALQDMQFIYGKQTGSWDGYKMTDSIKVEQIPLAPPQN